MPLLNYAPSDKMFTYNEVCKMFAIYRFPYTNKFVNGNILHRDFYAKNIQNPLTDYFMH